MLKIEPFKAEHLELFQGHFERHILESGRGEPHFMPYAPDDPDGPKGLDVASLDLPLDAPGWQRWFVAIEEATPSIVGHVDLKGDALRVGLHRCELGIGIERAFRGQGLGERLIQAAIDFARQAESLAWIDLKAFAHNTRALALYRRMGFSEIGRLADRFRIDRTVVEDVLMTLDVADRDASG